MENQKATTRKFSVEPVSIFVQITRHYHSLNFYSFYYHNHMSLHSSQQEMKDNGLDINHKSLHHTTKTASPEFKDKLSKQVDQWIANDQKRKTF